MSTRSPRKAALESRTKVQNAFVDPLKGVNLGYGRSDDVSASEAESGSGTESDDGSHDEAKDGGKEFGDDGSEDEEEEKEVARMQVEISLPARKPSKKLETPIKRYPVPSSNIKRSAPAESDQEEDDYKQEVGSRDPVTPPPFQPKMVKAKASPAKKQKVNSTAASTKRPVKDEPMDDQDDDRIDVKPTLGGRRYVSEMTMEEQEEEDSYDDVKPKINKSLNKLATPRKVKAEGSRSCFSGGGGGEKFVTTPANRTAMMEEMLLQVGATKMDWERVKSNAGMQGAGDAQKLAKYFTQTFKKHLLISVASDSFGKK